MDLSLIAKILLSFFLGFFPVIAFMPFFIKFGWKANLLAKRQYFDEKYKTVPVTGGICMFLVFFIVFSFSKKIFAFHVDSQIMGIVLGSMIIHFAGIYDDAKNAAALLKVIGQLAGVLIPIFFGIRVQIIYVNDIFNILFTVAWLVFMINAFNFLDILDGLTAGVAAISFLGLAIVAYLTQSYILAGISFLFTGILVGFLFYNFPPARIYMGDSGSMLLGFMIGCISIAISYAPLGREMAIFTPLIMLGLPIFDTVFVIIIRLVNHRSIFKGSMDHLALRLIASGIEEKKAIALIYLLALLFMLNGIIISRTPNEVTLVFVGFNVLLCVIFGIRMAKIRISR